MWWIFIPARRSLPTTLDLTASGATGWTSFNCSPRFRALANHAASDVCAFTRV